MVTFYTITPHMLQISSSTSKHNSTLDSIESNHVSSWSNKKKPIQPQLWIVSFSSWSNQKLFDSTTNPSHIISLLVESETSRFKQKYESENFTFPFYPHTFIHSPEVVIYNFKQICKLLITYLYVIYKYYHTNEGLGTAQYVTFFYMGSHLSELKSCALILSTSFYFIFTFK